MEKIYVKEILEAVGGQLLGKIDADQTFIVNVQTDSREAVAGDLFVAIIGENQDAHRYVPGAMDKGAEGCLVSTAPESIPDGKFCVLVPDTTKAMGDLARYYLRKLGIPVVAITGSVGKTTTKDMVASVLSTRYRTLKTAGNKNNHLGLPMTVFRLGAEDGAARVVRSGHGERSGAGQPDDGLLVGPSLARGAGGDGDAVHRHGGGGDAGERGGKQNGGRALHRFSTTRTSSAATTAIGAPVGISAAGSLARASKTLSWPRAVTWTLPAAPGRIAR